MTFQPAPRKRPSSSWMTLAVAAHRPVEALEVAVDDEDQIVEMFPAGERHAGQALGLVHLAVAGEAPDTCVGRVGDPAVGQVAVEAGLVGGVDEPEAHRHGRELPEVASARVRIRRQPAADLAAEAVEFRLAEPSLEERTGVDARGGVALEEDLVTEARRRSCRERSG